MKGGFLFFFLFIFCCSQAVAQPGNFYLPFNGTGQAYINSPDPEETYYAYTNAVQADGKLLVGGFAHKLVNSQNKSELLIVRYLPDGNPDDSFGAGGVLRIVYPYADGIKFISSIAIQSDGKLIVAGYSQGSQYRGFICRLLLNGVTDNSFGQAGWVFTQHPVTGFNGEWVNKINVLPDDKILALVGSYSGGVRLARYLSNGAVDNSFTIITGNIFAYHIKADNKIITGYHTPSPGPTHIILKEFLPDGNSNLSFGNAGVLDMTMGDILLGLQTINFDANGKIIVAGTAAFPVPGNPGNYTEDVFIARRHPGGQPDLDFGTQGYVYTDFGLEDRVRDIAVLPSGKILLAGNTYWWYDFFANVAIARYMPDGTLDNNFIGNGKHVFALNPDFYCENWGMQLFENRIYISGWGGDLVNKGMVSFCLANDEPAIPPRLQVNLCMPGFGQLYAGAVGNSYQWQISTNGSSFSDISNNSFYNGVQSSHLNLVGLPTSFTGYQYRCLVNGVVSQVHTIRFVNTWTGNTSEDWHVAGNWSCSSVPDEYTDVIVPGGKVSVFAAANARTMACYNGADVKVIAGVSLLVRD